MSFCRPFRPSSRSFVRHAVSALAVTAALLLTVLASAPAHAESGAHRNPPAPPAHTPIVVDERD